MEPQACATFADKTGSPTFADLGAALEATRADAALVATPDRFHAPLTLAALDAGLDVICEKPMAETLRDAAAMHSRAVERGRMLMVHHQLRWYSCHYEARRLLDAGAIGTLRRVDFHFSVHSDVCLSGYRSSLPHLVLQDLAIHHFDLIRFLSGSECESLYVRDWPAPETGLDLVSATHAVGVLNMGGPVTVNYTASIRELLDPVGYNCEACLHGSDGQLHLNDGAIRLQTRRAHADGLPARAITPGPPDVGTWASFADALETRAPASTHSGDNLNSLAMLFAAIESAETGNVFHPLKDFSTLL